eukprot:TRINITY_DN1517_c0_g1_i2.p1 TRINITY_DN1517_c0_g1~~TRINITY_DN1517_c0_g1_i2.p1  ORF type:complete len:165 (+),score=29.03 TRINITY_DN1517_c0_g1_i2:256-750(+)
MEDAHVTEPDLTTEHTPPIHFSFFAVYDGHGGRRAADYAATNLHKYLCQDPFFGYDPKDALRRAILQIEEEFVSIASRENLQDGTTAVIAMILGQKLIVANVGDSEAIICRGKTGIPLTTIHNPSKNTKEAERVSGTGGIIYRQRIGHPTLDVNCFSIAVSRAM